MTTFEFTPPDSEEDNRIYIRVDDLFDISVLRTEEGLIVDVYENEAIDLLGTLAIYDDDLSCHRQ